MFDANLMSLSLNALACRSIGSVLTYLPFMIEATSVGVATLFRNKSVGRGAFTITPLLSLAAYT